MNFEFVSPKEPAAAQPFFEQYDLDIDFTIFKNNVLQLQITADINCVDKPLPGYKISTLIAVLFRLDESADLTEYEKQSIEGYSSVYMALNCLRTLVSGFTANAPLGRYILPSIDLNDLIKKKRESVEAEKKVKSSGIKNKSRIKPKKQNNAVRNPAPAEAVRKPMREQATKINDDMPKKNDYYVERREDGDYAVRKPNSERASAVEPTQEKAIERAKEMNPDATIHVERVHHTTKGDPDKWRKP
jgi:hypothetical protein